MPFRLRSSVVARYFHHQQHHPAAAAATASSCCGHNLSIGRRFHMSSLSSSSSVTAAAAALSSSTFDGLPWNFMTTQKRRYGNFPSSSRDVSSSMSIPTLRLSPPVSMTHEHLAYAHCPVCREHLHMCDMQLHVTSKHKEVNPKHTFKMCQERLNLYKVVIGVALVKSTVTSSASASFTKTARGTSGSSSSSDAGTITKNDGTTTIQNNPLLRDEYMPTLVDGGAGGYICNWCERRDVIHKTRDLLLKHVAESHYELDLDVVESLVPKPKPALRGAAAAAHVVAPKRRLAQAVATAEQPVSFGLPPAPPTSSSFATGGGGTHLLMRKQIPDTDFPCELCGRVYQSEWDLLKHFENSHPLGEEVATTGGTGGNSSKDTTDLLSPMQMSISDIARMQQLDASSKNGDVVAQCDLCSSGKQQRFVRMSALFSHIRVKHPTVDAEKEMKRLLDKSKSLGLVSTSAKCPECGKLFASKVALDSHFKEKHATQTQTLSRSGMLSTVEESSAYWCNDCEKGFSSAKGLHGHLTGRHSMPSEVHPCPSCKRVFGDVFSLVDHVKMSHKTTDTSLIANSHVLTCRDCERVFLSESELRRHKFKHNHSGGDSRPRAETEEDEPRQPRKLTFVDPRAVVGMMDKDNKAASTSSGGDRGSGSSSSAGPRVASRRRFVSRNADPSDVDKHTNPIDPAEVSVL